MQRNTPIIVIAGLLVLGFGLTTHAEVTVTVDHNSSDSPSAEFRFKTTPNPRQNIAAGATFTILDGNVDPNSPGLDALHDVKIPDGDDEPDSNFFFAPGSNGGRLLIDLGKAIPVKEVNTYSWHSDSRAPQVYKLYGSNGSGEFVAKPQRPQDPAQSGWTLIASVDTRTTFQEAGGQYGVSVANAAGLVGEYRYLLFDMSRTEERDAFGNTFYSEINVVDRDAPANAAAAKSANGQTAKESFTYDRNGLHLVFTNDSPRFDPHEKDRLVDTFFTVYPQMMDGFNKDAAKSVTISIETKYHGVAATAGHTIHVNPDWFRKNPEDIDVITHEGMHVVQQYRQWQPGWLTEGIADYARSKYGVNNPGADWTMPDYKASQSYTNSYRITARFLVWLEKNVKPGLVKTLDGAMRTATYKPELWKEQTGKTVDELWEDYGKNPAL